MQVGTTRSARGASTWSGVRREAGTTGVGVMLGVGATGGATGHTTMTPFPKMRVGIAAVLAPPAAARGGPAIQVPMTPFRMAAVPRDAAALALLRREAGARLLRATSGSDFLGG